MAWKILLMDTCSTKIRMFPCFECISTKNRLLKKCTLGLIPLLPKNIKKTRCPTLSACSCKDFSKLRYLNQNLYERYHLRSVFEKITWFYPVTIYRLLFECWKRRAHIQDYMVAQMNSTPFQFDNWLRIWRAMYGDQRCCLHIHYTYLGVSCHSVKICDTFHQRGL